MQCSAPIHQAARRGCAGHRLRRQRRGAGRADGGAGARGVRRRRRAGEKRRDSRGPERARDAARALEPTDRRQPDGHLPLHETRRPPHGGAGAPRQHHRRRLDRRASGAGGQYRLLHEQERPAELHARRGHGPGQARHPREQPHADGHGPRGRPGARGGRGAARGRIAGPHARTSRENGAEGKLPSPRTTPVPSLPRHRRRRDDHRLRPPRRRRRHREILALDSERLPVRNRRRRLKKVQIGEAAPKPGARRSPSTFSARTRAPTKQMGPFSASCAACAGGAWEPRRRREPSSMCRLTTEAATRTVPRWRRRRRSRPSSREQRTSSHDPDAAPT